MAASKCLQLTRYVQTAKRDFLQELERKYQARWEAERIFEVEAPTIEECKGLSSTEIQEKYPKWFGNFPFPYMNGSLHLGHAFTISKIEYAAGFQRMLGKRVLFPHGFHVTGMPIKVRSWSMKHTPRLTIKLLGGCRQNCSRDRAFWRGFLWFQRAGGGVTSTLSYRAHCH